ncbi:MAG: winged helix-turn-helix domain-containing protein [Acetobacteraceae bacterium]
MLIGAQPDIAFGPFRLDRHRRRLTRDGVAIPLGRRAFDVLELLAGSAGETLGKSELLERAWPGVVVEENNLQVQISSLRRALGEAWIITVPGRGYRLVSPQAAPATSDAAGSSPPGIAVLAFAELGGDPAQGEIARGIADDLAMLLSHDRRLFVISRHTSFSARYRSGLTRQAAQELGIRYVLDGSVRQSAGRLRVNAHLLDATKGSHIWADGFERPLRDLFDVQDDITKAIVAAIGPVISHAERQRVRPQPPETLPAWEAYQRALVQWCTDAHLHDSARPFLRRAMTLDPNFGVPHALLALSHLSETSLGAGLGEEASLNLAEAESRTAISLDPACSTAYAVLSWVHGFRDEPSAAQAAAETAISHNVNDPMSHLARARVLAFHGQPDAARHSLAVTLRLDPLGPTAGPARMHGVIADYLAGDYTDAAAGARRMIERNPGFVRSYPWLAAALGQLGCAAEACAALHAGFAVAPQFMSHFLSGRRPPFFHREVDFAHFRDGLDKAGYRA